MSAHTPGPWIVSDGMKESGEISVQQSNNAAPQFQGEPDPRCIAIVHRDGWSQKTSQVKESRANARLIAAAPELLAALKQHGMHAAYCQSNDASLRPERCDVCDAIAHVEGRT